MDVEVIRNTIALALSNLNIERSRATPLGNRVHFMVDDQEFEIIVNTMTPKGSGRQTRYDPSRLDY